MARAARGEHCVTRHELSWRAQAAEGGSAVGRTVWPSRAIDEKRSASTRPIAHAASAPHAARACSHKQMTYVPGCAGGLEEMRKGGCVLSQLSPPRFYRTWQERKYSCWRRVRGVAEHFMPFRKVTDSPRPLSCVWLFTLFSLPQPQISSSHRTSRSSVRNPFPSMACTAYPRLLPALPKFRDRTCAPLTAA